MLQSQMPAIFSCTTFRNSVLEGSKLSLNLFCLYWTSTSDMSTGDVVMRFVHILNPPRSQHSATNESLVNVIQSLVLLIVSYAVETVFCCKLNINLKQQIS